MSKEDKKSDKVEDLVKKALKEALDKRRTLAPESTMFDPESECEEKSTVVASAPTSLTDGLRKLKSNQLWFSEVASIDKIDAREDFGVTVFIDYEWDERIASFIPEIDDSYVIDKQLSADILMAWELNEKVLCYGPTGAGKSSLIEKLGLYITQ